MSVPVLLNQTECIRILRDGRRPVPEIQRVESLADVAQGHLNALKSQLTEVQRIIERDSRDRVSFDGPAAAVLHAQLRLDRATASMSGFWAYLAVVEMPEIVHWRFGKPDAPAPENRYRGGAWKNTFKRLWFRAELAHRPDLDDPYLYAMLGGEDFWVGLIEREFSQCANLVRALLPYWFDEGDGETRSMKSHRRFFVTLRLLRPYRMFEALQAEEHRRLFDHAMALSTQQWVEDLL